MDKCMICCVHIPFGTPYISLNLQRETCYGNKVSVIDARGLMMWCERCARNHFGFVSADDPHQDEIPAEGGGAELSDPRAAVATESPSKAPVMDMIDVYLAGLEQEDPAVTEAVRAHLHSLVEDGAAEFLTILLKAIRDGLAAL